MKYLFVAIAIFSSVRAFADLGCAQHIRDIVCLVDSPVQEADRYKDGRTCLDGGLTYAPQITGTAETFPKFVQTALCSLKRIYIEKKFFGPAWSALENEEDPNSGLVGLRQAEFESNLNLQDHRSWFEQQSFGGSESYQIDPKLPVVRITPKTKISQSFLAHTLLHEMAHILDYQSHFNQVACDSKGENCRARAGSWTALSWNNIEEPNPRLDFPERKGICLNFCQGKFLAVERADEFYHDLYSHGFISQLAALNAMEDWAESFTFYVSAEMMGTHYSVLSPTGQSFAGDDVLSSKVFASKRAYLKKTTGELAARPR